MTKTDKAKGMSHLLKGVNDALILSDAKTLLIQDGNATFHAMSDIPRNFELISYQIFDNKPKHVNFLFSTDMYHDGSIKDMEREQRGSSDKLIIGSQLTKGPAVGRTSQLVHVMNEVLSSDAFAHKLQNRKIVSGARSCLLIEE